MIQVLMGAVVVLFAGSIANGKTDSPEPNAIGSAISRAHQDGMNRFFMKLQELSGKSQSEREFYAAIFGFKMDDARLSRLPADKKPPRIVRIGDGINIEGSERLPITVRLGKEIGTVEIKGMKVSASEKTSSLRLRIFKNLYSALIPSANAGLWDWLVGKGVGRLFNVADDMINADDLGRVYTNAERAALLAKGTAHVTAEAAIVGCVFGLHTSDENKLAECGTGAAIGAGLVVGAAGAVGGAGVVAYGAGTAINMAYRGYDALPKAAQLALVKATSLAGKAGVAAVLAHGVDSLVKSDGVKLICREEGSFVINDLSLRDKDRGLVAAEKKKINWYKPHSLEFERSLAGVGQFLESQNRYKSLPSDSKHLLAKSVMADLDRFTKICEKHGEGYTEVFRLEADKPAVETSKVPAKGTQSVK